jgi:hypothetical protein
VQQTSGERSWRSSHSAGSETPTPPGALVFEAHGKRKSISMFGATRAGSLFGHKPFTSSLTGLESARGLIRIPRLIQPMHLSGRIASGLAALLNAIYS